MDKMREREAIVSRREAGREKEKIYKKERKKRLKTHMSKYKGEKRTRKKRPVLERSTNGLTSGRRKYLLTQVMFSSQDRK